MNKFFKLPYWLILCLIILLCFVLSKHCFQLALVQGDSMLPSYHNNQLVIVDKISDEYHVGDTVLFYSDELKSLLIKRIVACPNDTLIINDCQLYVNNKAVPFYNNLRFSGIAIEEISLDSVSYFVIGDNFAVSVDSRDVRVGIVNIADIKGKIA